jgi:integrase
MASIKHLLLGLLSRNKDGSMSTQDARAKILIQASGQLKEGGYKLASPDSLKPKHIEYLVERWKSEGLSAGTIKNRMSHLRWWAEKVGKSSIIPKSNTGSNQAIKLDIDKRSYVPTETKAKLLDTAKLDLIQDPRLKLSLRLQKEFGLRREECLKFRPSHAVQGDKLHLKASWCKGGRARIVPIRTAAQVQLLNEIRQTVGNGSMIPSDKSYLQRLKFYENETGRAGLDCNHGLRHMYAQNRYEELTGWKCPIAGGPSSKELTPEQKQADREARLQISQELGHEREQITVTYIGR